MTVALDPAAADALLISVITDDDVRQDPLPVYRRLLAESPRWRSGFGMTVLAGYADCLATLRNPRWGRSEPDMEVPPALSGAVQRREDRVSSMLFLNPPDHTRIRSLVARAFTPRRVESLREPIGQLLEPILDEATERGEFDLMSTLAIPFPVAVISALLGVPQDPTGEFLRLVRDVTSFIDAAADDAAIDRASVAGEQLSGYFRDLIDHKRTHPDDGLLSALIEVEEAGDRLTPDELLVNTLLMYAAGFETTSNLIGNGWRALLAHPGELARLREDRSLVPAAMVEILRFDSPVQLNVRVALETDELAGEVADRGTHATILQGAANHDPAVYDRPERFDVARFTHDTVAPPLSFGWGAHHCLGAHLARAEGEIVFDAMLERFPVVELVGAEPRYRPSFTLRGLDALTLAVR